MLNGMFFNCSMPRSCSTLLQNILSQNPSIHATGTDGSIELLYGARINATEAIEFKAMDQDVRERAWLAFCKGGLKSYVNAISSRQYTCIKCRGVGIHYDWYSRFLEEPIKVICMVRDIRAILASMEKIFRKRCDAHQPIQNHLKMIGTTTAKRVDMWLNSQPIGLALERFSQMTLEGIDKKCLFVRAEDLTSDPESQMVKIYKYLEIPYYKHNFNHVEQAVVEDDVVYGLTNDLHKTRLKIEPLKPDYDEILGRDLCNSILHHCADYHNRYIW